VKYYQSKVLTKVHVVKAEDSEDLIIEGFANTVSKDRAGDVIPSTTWSKPSAMSNYLKNPIILAYHNHSKPIGRMIDWDASPQGLKITARISRGAGEVHQLIKDEVLSTFSVGFNILDAEYDERTDTFLITDVELHEVSVVAVPCNQDSTFSVKKSMTSQDFEGFKNKVTPTGDKKEEKMTLEEIKALAAELNANSGSNNDDIAKAVSAATQKALADAAQSQKDAEIAKEKALADTAAKAEAIKAEAKSAAAELIKELESKLDAKDGAFAEVVKANNDQLVSLKDEIAQIVAARNNPAMNPISSAVRGTETKQFSADADALMFVSTIKKVGIFDSELGKSIKAVNASSSIQVSSDGYETTFGTNLIRDIQAALVVAPLFTEMAMNSATMTIPVNPDRTTATWIASATLADGSNPARTGPELTAALTERTLKTFKLAAKVFLTEETEEDAIISLVPILRSHLVEAHAKAIDAAFLVGTGVGQPKGLATQANAVPGQTFVTAAKADGTVKVTAAEILASRRGLGLYGINLDELYVIISQDAYWDLIQDTEWADVQQVGQANSTKLVGEVGNIYGMRVLVSNEFDTKAVATAYGVIVNASNFVVPRQRGVTVRSDFDIELDRTVFVATQRLNLEPMIEASAGNGKGVVSMQYAAV